VNTREKIAAGALLALAGIILMLFTSQSVATVGSMSVGVGLTLFLTNLKD
jgi:hypothetical protein